MNMQILLVLVMAMNCLCSLAYVFPHASILIKGSIKYNNKLYLKSDQDWNSDDDDLFNNDISEQKKVYKSTTKSKKSLSPSPVVLDAKGKWSALNRAVLAGVFVAGIGTGINLDSAINTNPKDLASRDAIDRNAPNPKLCATFGSSAMVIDQRVFVTFNPFNVFVTQGKLYQ
jgi:hypothetical protein